MKQSHPGSRKGLFVTGPLPGQGRQGDAGDHQDQGQGGVYETRIIEGRFDQKPHRTPGGAQPEEHHPASRVAGAVLERMKETW